MTTQTIRDRIVELRRVRAGELRPNPRNWRRHPKRQREALRALLSEVGFADAILARELDDGSLEIVDGHLRQSMDAQAIVPVLILDVDQDEADKLLATLDPLAAMAIADPEPLRALLESVETSSDRSCWTSEARSCKNPSPLPHATCPSTPEPCVHRYRSVPAVGREHLGEM